MKKNAYGKLDGVTEEFQNALDSVQPPAAILSIMREDEINTIPNTIDNEIPETTEDPILWSIQDSGLAIAKDYDWDLRRFLDARKALSEKSRNRYSRGLRGLVCLNTSC